MTLLSKNRQDLWQKRFQGAPFVPCATRSYSTQWYQSRWARPATTVRTDERTRGSLAGSSWTQNKTTRSKTVSRWWARLCEVGQRKEGQRTRLGAALGKPILAWSLLCRAATGWALSSYCWGSRSERWSGVRISLALLKMRTIQLIFSSFSLCPSSPQNSHRSNLLPCPLESPSALFFLSGNLCIFCFLWMFSTESCSLIFFLNSPLLCPTERTNGGLSLQMQSLENCGILSTTDSN